MCLHFFVTPGISKGGKPIFLSYPSSCFRKNFPCGLTNVNRDLNFFSVDDYLLNTGNVLRTNRKKKNICAKTATVNF